MRTDNVSLGEAFMSWRQDHTDIARIEASPILDHEEPFTDAWTDWKAFKSLVQPGDELWTFRSPQDEWDRHMGWQGILLIRAGVLADFLITAQN
jgi:hypothetical protein